VWHRRCAAFSATVVVCRNVGVVSHDAVAHRWKKKRWRAASVRRHAVLIFNEAAAASDRASSLFFSLSASAFCDSIFFIAQPTRTIFVVVGACRCSSVLVDALTLHFALLSWALLQVSFFAPSLALCVGRTMALSFFCYFPYSFLHLHRAVVVVAVVAVPLLGVDAGRSISLA
jgi:hypothetical protein